RSRPLVARYAFSTAGFLIDSESVKDTLKDLCEFVYVDFVKSDIAEPAPARPRATPRTRRTLEQLFPDKTLLNCTDARDFGDECPHAQTAMITLKFSARDH
ncbi:MAG: hypothetical protein O2851_01780, partial [Proteobacteria bacterium]|nr:hypothetical protein [Pseudomonadota bacterium]